MLYGSCVEVQGIVIVVEYIVDCIDQDLFVFIVGVGNYQGFVVVVDQFVCYFLNFVSCGIFKVWFVNMGIICFGGNSVV